MELRVPSNQYGYMIEGDEGLLQFQGHLFVSFERTPKDYKKTAILAVFL